MAEWDGLEHRCGCKITVGSNPTPSAVVKRRRRSEATASYVCWASPSQGTSSSGTVSRWRSVAVEVGQDGVVDHIAHVEQAPHGNGDSEICTLEPVTMTIYP